MAIEMEHILTRFSSVNRTHCFSHILNLVTKSLLKQFDVTRDNKKDEDLNDDKQELLALADDIKQEEITIAQENDNNDGETEDDDNDEGWVDEVQALTEEKCENLEESIRPVKKMLVKVKNSGKYLHGVMD